MSFKVPSNPNHAMILYHTAVKCMASKEKELRMVHLFNKNTSFPSQKEKKNKHFGRKN